jgi:hypothetical protein
MSGILNKTERFFDTVITEYGRDLLSKNNYNIKYATVSDKSIVYEKDFETSLSLPVNVSQSEYFYLPMESDTTLNNIIDDFEFNINYSIIYDINTEIKDINNALVLDALKENFAGEKIRKNLIISDRNFSSDKDLFFRSSYSSGESFNFNSPVDSVRYKTVNKEVAVLSQLPVILNDKRFYHKTNNKILSPLNSGGEVIDVQDEIDLEENVDLDSISEMFSVLKSYDVNFSSTNSDSRELTIAQLINHMEKNESIIRKTYMLKDITEKDSFVFEMFEVDFNAGKMEKLSLIDLGKVYDNENGISKDVYLIGKILNSRDKLQMSSKSISENISNVYREKNNFYLSSLYSYVNMFILVAE